MVPSNTSRLSLKGKRLFNTWTDVRMKNDNTGNQEKRRAAARKQDGFQQ